MKTTISLLTILLLFSACDKNKTYILKGRLIYNCGIPVSNQDLVELKTEGEFHTTTTDSNGYFTFTYKKGSFGVLRINKDKILIGIPLQTSPELDLGDVYVGGTIDLIVKLQVNNPHTENDTLLIFDLESNDYTKQIAIPGPFTTGVIDTFIDGYFPNFPIFYGKSPRLSYRHSFIPYTPDGAVYTDINVSFCDMNEITLVID